jgi:hypothetical protein
MLRVSQSHQTSLVHLGGLRVKLQRWWLRMTDLEERDVLIRASMVAVCAVAVSVTGPMVASVQADLRTAAEHRSLIDRFALTGDGGLAVRLHPGAPAVLDAPWLRHIDRALAGPEAGRQDFARLDSAALAQLVSFKPEHISRAEDLDAELKCLAEAVYYESAHEPLSGQLAVAEVVANRMGDRRYPDTACGVVYQGSARATGCQFTFTCDGALNRAPIGENWERAQRIAAHVLMGLYEERTSGATHYHATYVDPIWNSGLVQTGQIGLHVFYRFPEGSEWAAAQRRLADRRDQRAMRLAALDAASDMAAIDEGLLFSEASSAANDGYYTVRPSVAPASVVTSTRTVTSGQPREIELTDAAAEVAAYRARQVGAAMSAAGALR